MSPLPNSHLGGCQFAFWRLKLSWGCFIEQGGTPKSGILRVSMVQKNQNPWLEARFQASVEKKKKKLENLGLASPRKEEQQQKDNNIYEGLRSRRLGTGPRIGNSRKVLAGVLAQVLHSCWQVGPFGKTETKQLPAPVPALRPAPPFLPAPVPAPPPALFWNSHFGVLYQVAGISNEGNIGSNRRVLQGAPKRGRQCHFILAALQTIFSDSQTSHFYLKTCNPVKGTP